MVQTASVVEVATGLLMATVGTVVRHAGHPLHRMHHTFSLVATHMHDNPCHRDPLICKMYNKDSLGL